MPVTQLYVSFLSPYSLKALALMGYAQVPHEIVVETIVNRFLVLRRMTGKTMVPMLRYGDFAINDSTRIARHIAGQTSVDLVGPEPLLAWLIEDFCDEWIMRWFVRARWNVPENVVYMERAIGREMFAGVFARIGGKLAAESIAQRLRQSGLLAENAAVDASRDRTLAILDQLFERGLYVFGGRPTVADFALYGFMWQLGQDPATKPILATFPALRSFCERVHAWGIGGGESSETERDLSELHDLIGEILGTHWRVLIANRGLEPGEEAQIEFSDGARFKVKSSRWLFGCMQALLNEASNLLNTRHSLCADARLDEVLKREFTPYLPYL